MKYDYRYNREIYRYHLGFVVLVFVCINAFLFHSGVYSLQKACLIFGILFLAAFIISSLIRKNGDYIEVEERGINYRVRNEEGFFAWKDISEIVMTRGGLFISTDDATIWLERSLFPLGITIPFYRKIIHTNRFLRNIMDEIVSRNPKTKVIGKGFLG